MPTLERVPDVAHARAILAAFEPPSPEQAALRERFLEFVDAHPADAHQRSCVPGHLTASMLLVDAARERVLLHHHRKLGRWLQFGGHCDGDANLYACARRELIEESGIEPAWQSEGPIDLDAHVIPARAGEPEHVHWDVRYLAVAPRDAREVCSEESVELGWFAPAEARSRVDESVRRMMGLVF